MGEAALLAEAGTASPETSRLVFALVDALERAPLPGQLASVPGIASVLVRFDPLRVTAETIEQRLWALLATLEPRPAARARILTIPVVYGGPDGPDLADVAAQLGLTPAEVVAEHCRHVYDVLMIGFAPGFPYIGPVPERLHLPRRATPRTAVPAGSVALAAGLTGIYPARLPGGWHLIGRTPLRLFDPGRDPPALLAAGDGVRFAPQPAGIMP